MSDGFNAIRLSLVGASNVTDVYSWFDDLSIQYKKLQNSYPANAAPQNIKDIGGVYEQAAKDLIKGVEQYKVSFIDVNAKKLVKKQREDLLLQFAKDFAKRLDSEINSIYSSNVLDFIPEKDSPSRIAKEEAQEADIPSGEEAVAESKPRQRVSYTTPKKVEITATPVAPRKKAAGRGKK